MKKNSILNVCSLATLRKSKDLQIPEFSEVFVSKCNNLQDGFNAVDYRYKWEIKIAHMIHTGILTVYVTNLLQIEKTPTELPS